jgi:antitoxin component of MazEF toxin-antitoxin module
MSQAAHTMLTKTQDAGDGALFMPLPPELLEKLNIREGDRLVLREQSDGTLLLSPAGSVFVRMSRVIRSRLRGWIASLRSQ